MAPQNISAQIPNHLLVNGIQYSQRQGWSSQGVIITVHNLQVSWDIIVDRNTPDRPFHGAIIRGVGKIGQGKTIGLIAGAGEPSDEVRVVLICASLDGQDDLGQNDDSESFSERAKRGWPMSVVPEYPWQIVIYIPVTAFETLLNRYDMMRVERIVLNIGANFWVAEGVNDILYLAPDHTGNDSVRYWKPALGYVSSLYYDECLPESSTRSIMESVLRLESLIVSLRIYFLVAYLLFIGLALRVVFNH